MKILITGDKGYLGSEFIKRYSKDYQIVGYNHENGEDLLDYNALKSKMQGCEQVVHLAAIPKPVEGRSFEDYFTNNVQGTFNIAKAALENGLKRIIYASSTTIYGIERGIPFSIPISEDRLFVSQYIKADKLGCRDIDLSYHISKVMASRSWLGMD